MKAHKRIFVGLFCLAIFFFYNLGFGVSSSTGDTSSGKRVWWPFFEKADPPELVAFSWMIEQLKHSPVFPELMSDNALQIDLVPEVFTDSQSGVPAGFAVAIEVTKHLEHKAVFRRYVYHHVWTGEMGRLFHDTSFLNRTFEENRELAFGDVKAYWQQVEAAMKNVIPEAAEDALRTCWAFSDQITRGVSVSLPFHKSLQKFAERVDHEFSGSFEHLLGIEEGDPEKMILVFDYDPRHTNNFFLKVFSLVHVPTPFGSSATFERQPIIVAAGDWNGFETDFAKQAFRGILALRDIRE